jgi:hypothetical protein
MNHLNSVLLEGTVSGKICIAGKGTAKRGTFVLASLRSGCAKGVREETRIWVMIRSPSLVAAAEAHAYNGRGVRVVGRLACGEDDNVPYIEADHVEYRPEMKDREGGR